MDAVYAATSSNAWKRSSTWSVRVSVLPESFPDTIFAGMFQFRPAELWQVEAAEERAPVKVSF